MKRLVAMVVAAGAAMMTSAMPTKAELQKAQEMVNDVTAADVAALKAKSKTPAEVAAKHMELAGQAGSEAEKYLLLQGAFKLYAKAGDYDAAANVIEKLQAEISDYNPEVTVELCGAEFIRKMRENAPRLYALKENARRIVFYRKQLPIREAAVKKNPKDPQAQRKLAECHAELGDWTKALEVFVNAGGEFKKMSEGETSGKVPAQELGDFWWDYETKSDTQVYKLHAAELYRKALADDSFKGLARTRAEQRVKEAAVDGGASAATIVGKAPQAVVKSLPRFDLRYDHHLHFKFYPCPVGSAKIKNVSINVTRPFCLGVTPVTRREWFEVRKEKGSSWKGGENAPMTYVTYQEVCDFAVKLTARFFNELPKGYVIRLPTAAEWCLAYQLGHTAPEGEETAELRRINFEIGWFGQGVGGTPGRSNMKKYYEEQNLPVPLVKDIWPDFVPAVDGGWVECTSQFAPVPVGLKHANDLGFHDMYGNCFEMMLDCVEYKGQSVLGVRLKNIYAGLGASLNDPFIRTGSNFVMLGSYMTPGLKGDEVWTTSSDRLPLLGVRLCIGHDLVAEKKAKGNGDADVKKAKATGPVDCYPREDFGGVLLSSKYEIVEKTGGIHFVRYLDGLFNCQKAVKRKNSDFAFEVGSKGKEAGFTLKLPESITLAGLLIVNRTETCQERQVPLCVWASEDRVKWDRIFIDESVKDEYRIDLSDKNITCKYLRFGRLPGVNDQVFHLARTLVYVKPSAAEKKAKK